MIPPQPPEHLQSLYTQTRHQRRLHGVLPWLLTPTSTRELLLSGGAVATIDVH